MIKTPTKVPNKNAPVELYLKKQVTVAAGASETVSIPCPKEQAIYIKGYGYDWFKSNTFKLRAGKLQFPPRTDQEGSVSQPVIYSYPFEVLPGENFSLKITNGDASDHTYQVLFIVLSSSVLEGSDYESEGGAIVLATDATGSGATLPIAVYDPTGTTPAGVTANGLQVENNAPVTLQAGSIDTSSASAVPLVGSATALKRGVLLQAKYTNTDYVLVGNATNQDVRLYAGDTLFIDINDLNKVYIKRPSATNVGVAFEGS